MKMFRVLLVTGFATACLPVVTARPAHAQMAVFDVSSFMQLVQQAERGVQELVLLKNQLGVSQDQYNQLITFYQSFSHLTNASQFAPTLLQQSTVNPLPDIAAAEAALRGAGVGFSGNLAGSIQSMLAQIQVYKPSGTDFAAQQMNRAALASAGQMAAAEQLYGSSTQRIQGLQELQQQLSASADPKTTLDLTARATIENGLAQAQANQGIAMSVMQQAQQQSQVQQQDQAWRQGADNLENAAKSAASAAGAGTVQLTGAGS
jgi:hypothetical protein